MSRFSTPRDVDELTMRFFKKMNPRCTCGGDSRDIYWHEPRCELETKWYEAYEKACEIIALHDEVNNE